MNRYLKPGFHDVYHSQPSIAIVMAGGCIFVVKLNNIPLLNYALSHSKLDFTIAKSCLLYLMELIFIKIACFETSYSHIMLFQRLFISPP